MYKDKEKQKEANRLAAKKARDKRHTPVIPNPVIPSYPFKEKLSNPKVKKEYDKLEPKYNKIKEKIRKTLEANLPRTEEELKLWREQRWKIQKARDQALQK